MKPLDHSPLRFRVESDPALACTRGGLLWRSLYHQGLINSWHDGLREAPAFCPIRR